MQQSQQLPIPLRGLVTEQELKTTKNGSLYWRVVLKTRLGLITLMKWDALPDAEIDRVNYPHVNDLIEVTSFKDQLVERQNVVINKFDLIQKEDLSSEEECILELEKASQEEMEQADKLIFDNSFWEVKDRHQFVMNCLDKLGLDNIKKSPAAEKVHHSYQGGLWIHTAEVLNMCRAYNAVTKKYNFISKDVLYASAILHDMGKSKTYEFNELNIPKQLKKEQIIGHLFYAMHIVQLTAEETQFQDHAFVDEVLHCIAAHHGRKEWGSIVDIQSLEAGIVSNFDYLSSRNGMIEKAIKENPQTSSDIRLYRDNYFITEGIKSYLSSK